MRRMRSPVCSGPIASGSGWTATATPSPRPGRAPDPSAWETCRSIMGWRCGLEGVPKCVYLARHRVQLSDERFICPNAALEEPGHHLAARRLEASLDKEIEQIEQIERLIVERQ